LVGFARQHAFGQQVAGGQAQRHPGAGDGGGARAAVGLDHVAVQRDLPLAQRLHIDHRPHRAADQALDFLGAARLLSLSRFAATAGVGGAGQHAVFRGHPALALAAQEARHALVHAGGDQHLGMAERH
jgi:hypothetical protein